MWYKIHIKLQYAVLSVTVISKDHFDQNNVAFLL